MATQLDYTTILAAELQHFMNLYDYEAASTYYRKHVCPTLDKVTDDETRSDLRFGFMEHLHDLSVIALATNY